MTKALWIWRDLEKPEDFHLSAGLIASIRKLAAGWNTVETGAAGFVFPGEAEAGDIGDSDLATACEIFLNTADPGDWRGAITNPYRNHAYKDALAEGDLVYVPDQSAIEPLANGEGFEFVAKPHDIAAWAEADLRAGGIDPKRPFGTGNPARDLTAIIDPDQTLSQEERSAKIDQLQSRMVLMLQYFVQHAQIEPGWYGPGEWGGWEPRGSTDTPGEMIDHDEWVTRAYSSFSYETLDYIECCEHLSHLVWDNRAKGDYASLVQQFRLDGFYEVDTRSRFSAPTIEQLSTGVRAFPQNFHDGSNVILSLAAIRAHNSRAEYAQALKLLKPSKWESITPREDAIKQPDRRTLLAFEGLIASYGSGALSDEAYQTIISGLDQTWNVRFGRKPWDFIWKLTKDFDKLDELEFPFVVDLCKAAAWQLTLMRGGFVPDED